MLQLLRGITFLVLIVGGVVISFILMLPWLLTMLCPLNVVYRIRRSYLRYLNQAYFLYCAAILQYFCNVRIFLHQEVSSNSDIDSLLRDRSVFILSNHPSCVDWMFSGWCYTSLFHHYPFVNFILKDSLRNIPFFGWSMQALIYIFLGRKRDTDIPHINQCLSYTNEWEDKPSIFIFPEGTDLSNRHIQKNNEYAINKGLQTLKRVLYPKPTGFNVIMSSFVRQHASMVIHDVTLSYVVAPGEERPTEMGLLKGRFPLEVHLLVRRYLPSEIPSGIEGEKQWLTQLFLRKEKDLEDFYTNTTNKKSSWGEGRLCIVSPWRSITSTLFLALMGYLIYYLLSISSIAIFLVLFHCLFFAASPLFGGVDLLEMRCAKMLKLSDGKKTDSDSSLFRNKKDTKL